MSPASSSSAGEFDLAYAAEQLRRSQHPMRRIVKGFYHRNVVRHARGPTIDFGCGAGQMLERLPAGSVGLELNPHLIKALRERHLSVVEARGDLTDFELKPFQEGVFRSLIISHVLEHLPDPAEALAVMFRACQRLGITRVIAVVPGEKGYASDRTHKTFIDKAYLDTRLPQVLEGFSRTHLSYYPGPWEWVGRYYVFHELQFIFDFVGPRR